MANPEHVAILKKGVEPWNQWRQEHPEQRSTTIEKCLCDGSMAGVSVVWSDPSRQGLDGYYIYWGTLEQQVMIRPTEFSPPDLRHADLSYAMLRGVDLRSVNLYRADLHHADLTGADCRFANLRHTDLQVADLTKADLTKADLLDADLRGAIIDKTKMTWTMLAHANLLYVETRSANLSTTHLQSANLSKLNLSGVDLSGSVLKEADLSGANLNDANLARADVASTIFADLDLSSVKGLETVIHSGPSTIGVDTIYKSRGKIPEVFLRGCGLADEFIAYIGSMVGRPIEFYSCFISYSTRDQEFADRLYADLQAKGVRCWFAPHHIKGGRKVHEQLDEAIRLHDKLLLILSEHSMSSEWVKTEIAKARKREVKEGKQVLFPVRLVSFGELRDWECFDSDIGKDSAREIRDYFIPDFSNWKRDQDSYRTAFQRLLMDLKANEARRP